VEDVGGDGGGGVWVLRGVVGVRGWLCDDSLGNWNTYIEKVDCTRGISGRQSFMST
jgi:hypothetical protein